MGDEVKIFSGSDPNKQFHAPQLSRESSLLNVVYFEHCTCGVQKKCSKNLFLN